MESARKYHPLACSLHDHLESFATLGHRVFLKYRSDGIVVEAEDIIVDISGRNGVEYLKLASGIEIRLDDLQQVGDLDFNAGRSHA